MDYVMFAAIGFIIFLIFMQVRIFKKTKKMVGQAAPDSSSIISSEQKTKDRLVYYFFSKTCGPCRAMTPVVDSLNQESGDFVKVDIHESQDLAREFGIMATPTTVLVENGVVTRVLLGAKSRKELLEFRKAL